MALPITATQRNRLGIETEPWLRLVLGRSKTNLSEKRLIVPISSAAQSVESLIQNVASVEVILRIVCTIL